MRNLLFEKRNCTIEEDNKGDFVITFLDGQTNELTRHVSAMLGSLKEKQENTVLWWNNRGLPVRTRNQYAEIPECPVASS